MFRVFFDMDGTLAEWKAAKEPEDLYEKDYFLSLKPYQSVVEAAWKLYESGEAEVFILSAVLDDSRYAISEKDAWLNEYLSFVDVDHRIYVEGSVPKHLRVPGGVRMTDVLVDDYTKRVARIRRREVWPSSQAPERHQRQQWNVDRHFRFALLLARFYCESDFECRTADAGLAACGREGGALIASKHFTQFSACKARKCVV